MRLRPLHHMVRGIKRMKRNWEGKKGTGAVKRVEG